MTDRATVLRWLAGYEAAWRAPGTEALASLFTADASYLQSPYAQPVTGLDAIGWMWEAERQGPDEAFSLATDILAVDGPVAVVWGEVRYGEPPARNTADRGSSASAMTACAPGLRNGSFGPAVLMPRLAARLSGGGFGGGQLNLVTRRWGLVMAISQRAIQH